MEQVYIVFGKKGNIESMSTTELEGARLMEVESATAVMEAMDSFFLLDGELVESKELRLEAAKARKIEEMGEECEKRILKGFSHNGKWFSYDRESQINITNAVDLLEKDLIETATLTAQEKEEYVRVDFTLDEMHQLLLAAWEHKDSCIDKLRGDLIPLIESLDSAGEVDTVKWNTKNKGE